MSSVCAHEKLPHPLHPGHGTRHFLGQNAISPFVAEYLNSMICLQDKPRKNRAADLCPFRATTGQRSCFTMHCSILKSFTSKIPESLLEHLPKVLSQWCLSVLSVQRFMCCTAYLISSLIFSTGPWRAGAAESCRCAHHRGEGSLYLVPTILHSSFWQV